VTAFQLLASLPPLSLDAGCTITAEAIDPDTGAAVTGVTISSFTIYATNVDAATTPDAPVPLMTLEPTTIG